MFSAGVITSVALLMAAVPAAFSASGGTPGAARVLGPMDPTAQISVTFWLNLHNKAALDAQVRQMYDRSSPSYHHWLTLEQYKAQFAPTEAEMAVVKQYLAANNLEVVYTDKLNHAVSARGSVADVQRAAGVQLNRMSINGVTHRVPAGEPAIGGAARELVYAVQGLTDFTYRSHAMPALDPDTGKPFARVPLSKAVPLAKTDSAVQYFNADCLGGPIPKTFYGTPGTYAQYNGTRYGDSIANGPPKLPPCGYDAPQMQTAYGLASLYANKLNGSGQTIVIVDAYGSDTIKHDANVFSQINGLPALTAKNFSIYYPTGPTNCGGNTCGWDAETSIDVEWSHSVAPGANIALVLGLDNSDSSLDLAVLYAIDNELGSVISNSYGEEELLLAEFDPGELIVDNFINETGAALGISVNYSSGDYGDYFAADGFTTVTMPASSPYATAVGGTSVFLNPNHSIETQTGWGTNLTRIASYATSGDSGQPPLIPPLFEGFYFGAGGGASGVWPLPPYQSSLPGTWRLVPDIAMVADPYTGGEIIDTEGGEEFIAVYGGTSLACPMFSGIWAIANEAAGMWLGQAAPTLYGLPAGAITDVVAVNGSDNVNGYTHLPNESNVKYPSAKLLAPVEGSTDFIGALYNGTSTRWYAISFGTDSSLTTGAGWDDVTGLGTPNGADFVDAVAAAAAPRR
jgi:subtilase family serine protease